MGLGTKIKEALHGDNSTTETHPTTANHPSHTTPGSFPSDELPQRHADGKHYTAPHGTAVDDNVKSGTHTGATSGTDDQDQTKGAYWGDLSNEGHEGHSGTAGDLPDRTRLGGDSSAASGRHHGAQAHHHDHRLTDQAVGGGVYNASPAQGSHGASNRDPTEDPRFGHGVTGTSASRDHHLAGQSSGGGVYNSVTGSGSPDHHATRHNQTDSVHDPLSSGTKGIPISSGHDSAGVHEPQRTGFQAAGEPTRHNERTGHSHGLGVTGAAAGAAAGAGYGAHEYGQHNNGNTNYSGKSASDGVPRSSMLDPEPASNQSNLPVSGHPHTSSYSDSKGIHGAGAGSYNNPGGPTSHLSGGPSHVNTNIGAGAGPDSSVSPTQSASSGSGRKHFGPGHEGAKVLHSCQHCGRDNDISHYFNKDVVYRLGQ
ncbi:hypothetical protein N0V93_010256 [Gnomoniopsis smithogilvyi]|uniref:Uncharacterized protein n=1 Tax=Gnomoniopsis smithogilvyi TaxID=1191159 RepID=A0A9W9CT49_9PEZI|nr:hypothetical protein N0V93_010256 [Gnomoniopsis smithogilvyi]